MDWIWYDTAFHAIELKQNTPDEGGIGCEMQIRLLLSTTLFYINAKKKQEYVSRIKFPYLIDME